MPTPSNQGMQLLTDDDLHRIYGVTDALQLHRDWIVIPADARYEGQEYQQPDGKIIIHAPVRAQFEAWLKHLRSRLQLLDLGRVPRPYVNDPNLPTGPFALRPMGTRSY